MKNDRVKMKNSKSETLTPHFFRKAEVVSATKAGQNPNDRNRKKEKGFGHLNFGNWDLFRIWNLGFDNIDCHFAFCPVFNTGLNFKFPSVRKFLFTIYCLLNWRRFYEKNFFWNLFFACSWMCHNKGEQNCC